MLVKPVEHTWNALKNESIAHSLKLNEREVPHTHGN